MWKVREEQRSEGPQEARTPPIMDICPLKFPGEDGETFWGGK